MKERVFQERFRNHIISLGGIAKKIPGNLFMKGWPDVYIAIRNGDIRFEGWVEFKGPDTVVSSLQWKVIRDLQFRGVNAFVIRAYEDHSWSIQLDDVGEDRFDCNNWDKDLYLPVLLQAATLVSLNLRNLTKEQSNVRE